MFHARTLLKSNDVPTHINRSILYPFTKLTITVRELNDSFENFSFKEDSREDSVLSVES